MNTKPDVLQASIARFLIDGGQDDAASVLLACSMTWHESGDAWWNGDEQICALHIEVAGPRAAYEILCDDSHAITQSVKRAIEAVLPGGFYLKHFTAHAELIDIDPDWRSELLEIARGRGIDNQAVNVVLPRVWNNLRFRSESEVRTARALDKRGVLFLPNTTAQRSV